MNIRYAGFEIDAVAGLTLYDPDFAVVNLPTDRFDVSLDLFSIPRRHTNSTVVRLDGHNRLTGDGIAFVPVICLRGARSGQHCRNGYGKKENERAISHNTPPGRLTLPYGKTDSAVPKCFTQNDSARF